MRVNLIDFIAGMAHKGFGYFGGRSGCFQCRNECVAQAVERKPGEFPLGVPALAGRFVRPWRRQPARQEDVVKLHAEWGGAELLVTLRLGGPNGINWLWVRRVDVHKQIFERANDLDFHLLAGLLSQDIDGPGLKINRAPRHRRQVAQAQAR